MAQCTLGVKSKIRTSEALSKLHFARKGTSGDFGNEEFLIAKHYVMICSDVPCRACKLVILDIHAHELLSYQIVFL
ncbi:MAG: hypothetical protein BA872_04245 [Desulfobacterales bacterium C00003060]|nr:MAG: hypothetical protein BA872_04245 [Desulfobacterales bacterium C00003060]